jgi:hypothetical protein
MPPFLLQPTGKSMTIEPEEKPTFTQEDLAEIETDAGDDGADDGKGAGEQTGDAAGKASKEGTEADDGEGGSKTMASGDAEEEAAAKQKAKDDAHKAPAYKLTDEMRKTIAEHYAAGDKKVYEREMKRLARMDDIRHVWGSFRELEGKFTSGGLVKVPGKDAKPEEIEAFHKQLGVPEKPEDYFKDVQLENGAVIGDADKPFVDTFASSVHKAGATPQVVSAALNWYYKMQEDRAAETDESDEGYRSESTREMKEEWGPAYKRNINAILGLFSTAPGGTDVKNDSAFITELMTARTQNGKIIGNHPAFWRWMHGMRMEINPAATVVEDGKQSGMTIDQELEKLQTLRTSDRRKYWSSEVQAREAELYAIQEKIRAKQGA